MCCLTSSLVPPYGDEDLVCYLGLWFHLWEQGPCFVTLISGSTYGNRDLVYCFVPRFHLWELGCVVLPRPWFHLKGTRTWFCYLGLWFHLWEQGPGLLTSISGSTYGNRDLVYCFVPQFHL